MKKMTKPTPEPVFDAQLVAEYLKQEYGLKKNILFDYLQRSHSYFGQDVCVAVFEEHLNPEVYNVHPDEIVYLKNLLNDFGTKDEYGNRRVLLKVWW